LPGKEIDIIMSALYHFLGGGYFFFWRIE